MPAARRAGPTVFPLGWQIHETIRKLYVIF
jgi:hypothetical protein